MRMAEAACDQQRVSGGPCPQALPSQGVLPLLDSADEKQNRGDTLMCLSRVTNTFAHVCRLGSSSCEAAVHGLCFFLFFSLVFLGAALGMLGRQAFVIWARWGDRPSSSGLQAFFPRLGLC